MNQLYWRAAIVAAIFALVASACTRRLPETTTPPPSTVGVGECADPERDGVVSESPDLMRADRDLNGDGADEIVVADRSLCNRAGNCQWNVFTEAGDCPRYVGTIGAAAIERLESRGEDGFYDLRGWWQLGGEGRMLMQEYSVQQGGYRVIQAMPCTSEPGGRMVCGEDATAGGGW